MKKSKYNTYLIIGWMIILKEILQLHLGGGGCKPNSSCLGYDPVVGPCEYGSKPSGFMKT
jgi:hypothetical protein